MEARFDELLAAPPVSRTDGTVIGTSRAGRQIRAFRFGHGARRVSLLGGCHADEPVGPRLLRHLCGLLGTLHSDDALLADYEWWILPHINPDGEERNRAWYGDEDLSFDVVAYLCHVVRELPGDDVEFGFPRHEEDDGARPENRAAFDWWRSACGAFALHVSLHGMAFAAGPWFLIEETWKDRCEHLKARCRSQVAAMGYVLHDVERHGEKGFVRLGRGFCTRPDSDAMRRHFLALDDVDTADRFRPSSMETIRALGGDALTLVSEMPLFLTPGVGQVLGPPDPVADRWKEMIATWKATVLLGDGAAAVRKAALEAGLGAMPVAHQMRLQWTFIAAGIEQVELEARSGRGVRAETPQAGLHDSMD